MIRHSSDFRSLIFTFGNFFLLLALMQSSAIVGSFAIFAIAITTALCYFSTQVNHNQMHVAIFSNDSFNWFFNCILSLNCGLPVSLLYFPHIANHHPNHGNLQDWSGVHVAGNSQGLTRIAKAIINSQIGILKNRPRNFLFGLPQSRKTSLILESIVFVAFAITCLFWNWKNYLLFVFLPTNLAMGLLVFVNFLLHDNTDVNSNQRHSHTFTSPLLNYLTFNGGYHLAHHHQPNLHWSRLPVLHQQMGFQEFKELNHVQALPFIIRNYVVRKPARNNLKP